MTMIKSDRIPYCHNNDLPKSNFLNIRPVSPFVLLLSPILLQISPDEPYGIRFVRIDFSCEKVESAENLALLATNLVN